MSPALREGSAEVPWRRICGLRDVLIHNYMGVDIGAVWAIVQYGIPPLKLTVDRLLKLTQSETPDRSDRTDDAGVQ